MTLPLSLLLQATQVSPWVVTTDALEPFLTDAPVQSPPVLPYLQEKTRRKMPSIDLQVCLMCTTRRMRFVGVLPCLQVCFVCPASTCRCV